MQIWLITDGGNNKELTRKDRIVYENIEYSHIKEKRDNT